MRYFIKLSCPIIVGKRIFFIIVILFTFYLFIYRLLLFQKKYSKQSLPLILLYTYNRSYKTRDKICKGIGNGGHIVNFEKCEKKCEFSCKIEDFTRRSPSAVLFFGEDFYWSFGLTNKDRSSSKQRWIFWSWEAPINHPEYSRTHLVFNWFVNCHYFSYALLLFQFRTMTYRQDSDIVHDYGRYIARNLSYTIQDYQAVDFYLSKTNNQSTFDAEKEFKLRKNKILWIVSNCNTQSKRHQVAHNLSKHFPIYQYGKCGKQNKKQKQMPQRDFEEALFKYKFYLAFENAKCQDYITEKAFYNALAHGSIPIVLGANAKNYKKILPPNSFIHIEHYKNIEDVAKEVDRISKNLKLFKAYHKWRINYRLIIRSSSYFIDNLFCNLCIKLYQDKKTRQYKNFPAWLDKCH